MGAGWQRWWDKPRTLEEAYRETRVASPSGKMKARAMRAKVEFIPIDPKPLLDFRRMLRLYTERYDLLAGVAWGLEGGAVPSERRKL